jgi:RNA polymerase sigma factor (sigma-70 family)
MNAKGFERLLVKTEHLNRLQKIARKTTKGSLVSWEDAAQIANLKLLQAVRAGKFGQGSDENFYRWAAHVSKNEIIDFVRKESRLTHVSLHQTIAGTDLLLLEILPGESDPLNRLETSDLVTQVFDMLLQIDAQYPHKKYRQIYLRHASKQTQTEIAQAMGISQSAVSKRIREVSLLINASLKI